MADLTGFGSLFDFGSKIIDKIFPDKTAQAAQRDQAQLALLQMQQSGELEEMKITLSAIIAEANSSDPWTSRARPSFMYVMYIMILGSIPIGILSVFNPAAAISIAAGMKAWLAAIPADMWYMFGAGYLGYTHYRTKEKQLGVTK